MSKRAVLIMAKRSMYVVLWAGDLVQKRSMAVCMVATFKYRVCMYNNPKVGHNPPPPRVVPMLRNVWFGQNGPPQLRSSRKVQAVSAYRTLLRGVDCVN